MARGDYGEGEGGCGGPVEEERRDGGAVRRETQR